MLFRLTLASLSCILAAIYIAYFNFGEGATKQTLSNVEPASDTQPSAKNLLGKNQKKWNSELEKAIAIKVAYREGSNYLSPPEIPLFQKSEYISPVREIKISPTNISKLFESKNYIILAPTDTVNGLENPLYQLQLYANGKLLASYKVVTGRAYTQNRNRHISGTEAPLPDGKYKLFYTTIAGTHPEVGGRFLPIQPLFQTGRSALGIHYDPSFEKRNGEDGTTGCIALTNKSEFEQVLNYIRTYRPQYLEVDIQ